MTPTEFLAWEREQPDKHEYYRGEVFAMAGGSPRHNALVATVTSDLRSALRGGRCRVLSSDQRIAAGHERYVYADASVVCGQLELQPGTTDVVTNPSVVVEVLSRSTESYDRGQKWEGYQKIDSLTDYLHVSQGELRVEQFQRSGDGTWVYRAAGPGGRIRLPQGGELSVDDLFEGALDLTGD